VDRLGRSEAAVTQHPNQPRELTARQQRFIDEYLIDFNATAAARRAGYSAASAHQRGYELVHDPDVAAMIKERGASDAEVLGITRGYILTELREVLEQAKEDGKLGPANRALELLAKLRGDMIERSKTEVRGLHVVINGVDIKDLT
jgi:phage terminase small subunit